ncbi:MAG: hypothetical protein AAFU49_12975 [Pseudomonadota bacterium]
MRAERSRAAAPAPDLPSLLGVEPSQPLVVHVHALALPQDVAALSRIFARSSASSPRRLTYRTDDRDPRAPDAG